MIISFRFLSQMTTISKSIRKLFQTSVKLKWLSNYLKACKSSKPTKESKCFKQFSNWLTNTVNKSHIQLKYHILKHLFSRNKLKVYKTISKKRFLRFFACDLNRQRSRESSRKWRDWESRAASCGTRILCYKPSVSIWVILCRNWVVWSM